jgi:serpin B
MADPEAARKTINAWVSQRTAGRIPELLGPPDVTDATRLALVNAIYLKANWETLYNWQLFAPDATKPAPFTRLDGSRVDVATMEGYGVQVVPYARGTGWQATELRYQGPNGSTPLALTLILPDDLAAFEASLTASQLGRITTVLEAQRTHLQQDVSRSGMAGDCGTYAYAVDLFLPRFRIDTRASLADGLTALGMPLAFDSVGADFFGIHVPANEMDRLYVSRVIHQATMAVDE